MKSNKRLIRKEAYRRYSSATGGVMGPPTEQEVLAGAKVKGKGWTLLSDVLGTATAFFSGGWKKPYNPTDEPQQVITPRANNMPLFIGLAIVVMLVVAVIITRKP